MLATAVRSIEIPSRLLAEVLRPYRPGCTYLKQASAEIHRGDEREPLDACGGAITGRGRFAIAESFYIDSTGHFNAVEFNLCFNQLSYVFVAFCLARDWIPSMRALGYHGFCGPHLQRGLIVDFRSHFQRPMRSDDFEGVFTLDEVIEKRNYWLLRTRIRFFDQDAGRSHGAVLLAFLKPRAGAAERRRPEPRGPAPAPSPGVGQAQES